MTKYTLGLVVATITLVAAIYDPDKTSPRKHTYPFLVSVQQQVGKNDPRHGCAGVIISADYILTSANCLTFSHKGVIAGNINLNIGGSFHLITEQHMHEGHEWGSADHDIALAKVSPSFQFGSHINAATLELQDISAGTEVYFAGWGASQRIITEKPTSLLPDISYIYPDVLQHVALKTISNKICNDYKMNATNEEMCTLTYVGQGLCNRDEGGPLITKGSTKKVMAVATSKYACGYGLPDVYTKISPYVAWIKEKCNNCI